MIASDATPGAYSAVPYDGAANALRASRLTRSRRQLPSLVEALVGWFTQGLALLGLGALLGLASAAWANPQADGPGRVGRVADVQGRAWFFDEESKRWSDAQRNRSVTEGDRFSTESGGRLQLAIGSTEVRLGSDSEISFDRLDDDRARLYLHRGSMALRMRNREVVREWEVRTLHGRFRPEQVGHFRIDREDNRSAATVWRGTLSVDTEDSRPWSVNAGQRVELLREGRDGLAISWGNVQQDPFSDWVARDEDRDDRWASQRYISPEMTGADELERHGRWERHPEYGMVWTPLRVAVDWVPFRHGRWTWHVRWGWTWVDDAPWGFATSHYGRWSSWGGRWVWVPGAYVARPVYAPALVAWTGGVAPGVSVNIQVGPSVGWRPLAPRDVYVPPFRHTPRYVERVNQPYRWQGAPAQVPTGPIMYGPNGTPQSVSAVGGGPVSAGRPDVGERGHREGRGDRGDRGDRAPGGLRLTGPDAVVSMPALPTQPRQPVVVTSSPVAPQPARLEPPAVRPAEAPPKPAPRMEQTPKMHRAEPPRDAQAPAREVPKDIRREGLRERQERL